MTTDQVSHTCDCRTSCYHRRREWPSSASADYRGGIPPPVCTITRDDLDIPEALTLPHLHPTNSTAPSRKRREFCCSDTPLNPLFYVVAVAISPHITQHYHCHRNFSRLPKPSNLIPLDDHSNTNADDFQQTEIPETYSACVQPSLTLTHSFNASLSRGEITEKAPCTQTDQCNHIHHLLFCGQGGEAEVERDGPLSFCARRNLPTPHYLTLLHLYHNSRGEKEGLVLGVDPAKFRRYLCRVRHRCITHRIISPVF